MKDSVAYGIPIVLCALGLLSLIIALGLAIRMCVLKKTGGNCDHKPSSITKFLLIALVFLFLSAFYGMAAMERHRGLQAIAEIKQLEEQGKIVEAYDACNEFINSFGVRFDVSEIRERLKEPALYEIASSCEERGKYKDAAFIFYEIADYQDAQSRGDWNMWIYLGKMHTGWSTEEVP